MESFAAPEASFAALKPFMIAPSNSITVRKAVNGSMTEFRMRSVIGSDLRALMSMGKMAFWRNTGLLYPVDIGLYVGSSYAIDGILSQNLERGTLAQARIRC